MNLKDGEIELPSELEERHVEGMWLVAPKVAAVGQIWLPDHVLAAPCWMDKGSIEKRRAEKPPQTEASFFDTVRLKTCSNE